MSDINIAHEILANKVILEVGSGRGDSTRSLVDIISGQPGARLIVTDLSDQFFHQLQAEFAARDLPIEFICTAAQNLEGTPAETVDFMVCNYTLCAVNAQAGAAALALRRFYDVLKPGGKLYVEEEFPLEMAQTAAQEVWAEKWRILKAAQILTGRLPYNELAPEVLAGLCCLAGFEHVRWEAHAAVYPGEDALDFFRARLDSWMAQLPSDRMRDGFAESAAKLSAKAAQINGMEVPYYRLVAHKPAA